MIDESKTDSPEARGKLFSVGQITLATFLGMPVAGCLLLARNYKQLGKVKEAWKSLVWGAVATVLLLLIAFWLPDNFPNAVLPIAYCFGLRQLTHQLQGDAISEHMKAGGKQGSWFIAVAVGLGCFALIFGIAIALIMILVGMQPGAR